MDFEDQKMCLPEQSPSTPTATVPTASFSGDDNQSQAVSPALSQALSLLQWHPDAPAPLVSSGLFTSAGVDDAAPTPKPADESVEFCHRAADLPLLKQMGVQHQWIRTPSLEAGMGKFGAGVPGQPGGSALAWRTTMNDHTGQGDQPGAECLPAGEVNPQWAHERPDCIQQEAQVGNPTGLWIPPFNDCHSVEKNILDDCADTSKVGPVPRAIPAMGSWQPTDGGVPSEAADAGEAR